MAKSSSEVIAALRNTALRIGESDSYQWGHMGSCNCGFLAQEITRLSKNEIHNRAMQKYGDWREQLNDYCPTSGLPMDDLIGTLLSFGFDRDDLAHLERLSDPRILRFNSTGQARMLACNSKADVMIYLNTWADWLEWETLKHSLLHDTLRSYRGSTNKIQSLGSLP